MLMAVVKQVCLAFKKFAKSFVSFLICAIFEERFYLFYVFYGTFVFAETMISSAK